MAKVLIVEDEGILAMNTKICLTDMGHQVVGIASNGNQAVELTARENPDYILMDIFLQGVLDGVEVTRMLGKKFPSCNVIYMTAHTDPATLKRVKQTKYVGFIKKPFEPYQLQKAIDDATRS